MNYIVLGGGISPEATVSLRSAAAVTRALTELGHTVTTLDPKDISTDELISLATQSDGVFPILHGLGGEDGTLQAAFETAHIPYFGPSQLACANTFDKVVFKKLLEVHGLPTPVWNTVTAKSLLDEPLTKKPFVLKPITGGSSIDTFIIRDTSFEPAPLLEALTRYESMLIEELIMGDEITVGVLETTALPVIEIIPPQDSEFDYENKYNGATRELCPPENISGDIQKQAQELAQEVHNLTHCRHISRTDMMVNSAGDIFIIDTNTIPGLTDQSLFPKAAAEAGYSWNQLVEYFATLLRTS